MSNLIILSQIKDINAKIDKEIEMYEEMLGKCESKLSFLREERRQLIEVISILAHEKNK